MAIRYILLSAAIFLPWSLSAAAQIRVAAPADSVPTADVLPVPRGGVAAIERRIRPPAETRRARLEGTVWVRMVITPDGRARDVVVTRGISQSIDDAVADAVRRTRFAAGVKDGEPVAVQILLPVHFRSGGTRMGPPPLRRGACTRQDC